MDDNYVMNSTKIPRPANAFMLYANENRKRMALLHPQESNKEISKRLGISWKALDANEKKKYFDIAKTVDAEHKRKYPDYVYNPKEARIRKAMREASRERVVGTAPIPSPRGGGRRSQTWTSSPEEQLMMAPTSELSGGLCGNPIFAVPTSSVSQFMQPINSYTKLVHVLPTSGWLQDAPTYMQHNPMADLQQHQANMWQQYQDPIRTCSGPTYMLDSQVYHDLSSSDLLSRKKCNSEGEAFSASVPSCNETALPPNKIEDEKGVKNEKMEECSERTECEGKTPTNSRDVEQAEKFVPVYQETVVVQNPFDKDESEVKLKKDLEINFPSPANSCDSHKCQETLQTYAYNVAAAHYITPPDCPLVVPLPNDSSPLRETDLHVKNTDCNLNQNNLHEESSKQAENNISFSNYMNYPFSIPLFHDHCNMLLLDNCNPNMIYTDVGVIPMYGSDMDLDRLLTIASNVVKINK